MRHAILIVVGVALAGCFGAGPVPSGPTGADVVFALPAQTTDCGLHPYIGDVAIDATGAGFVAVGQYLPPANCNANGGGGGGSASSTIEHFVPTGGDPETSAMPASDGNGIVRIDQVGGVGRWLSASGGQLAIGASDSTTVDMFQPDPMYGQTPIGLVSDADANYVALTSMGLQTDFASPSYPCCGGGTDPSARGSIWKLVGSTASLVVTVALQCAFTEHCVAANADTLVYATGPLSTTTHREIHAIGKSGTPADTMIGIVHDGGFITGIAATSTYAVWSIAQDPSMVGAPPQCEIDVENLATGLVEKFSTMQFSCAGVAVEEGDPYAYFAIVSVPFTDSGQAQNMIGLGIARVMLSTPTALESLALGFTGRSAGPRRVIPVGDNVFAVDPFAIGKIAKSALTDAHDFTP